MITFKQSVVDNVVAHFGAKSFEDFTDKLVHALHVQLGDDWVEETDEDAFYLSQLWCLGAGSERTAYEIIPLGIVVKVVSSLEVEHYLFQGAVEIETYKFIQDNGASDSVADIYACNDTYTVVLAELCQSAMPLEVAIEEYRDNVCESDMTDSEIIDTWSKDGVFSGNFIENELSMAEALRALKISAESIFSGLSDMYYSNIGYSKSKGRLVAIDLGYGIWDLDSITILVDLLELRDGRFIYGACDQITEGFIEELEEEYGVEIY